MPDLPAVARIPHVSGAVLGDLEGGFHDAVREEDGESIAAVAGYVAAALGRAGGELGLGALQRVAVAGAARGAVVAIAGGEVVAVAVDAPAALPAVERALADSLGTGA
jgi:predicted regulator of Ras-like GTPase activity (Roadblock/LC7/MglB family)